MGTKVPRMMKYTIRIQSNHGIQVRTEWLDYKGYSKNDKPGNLIYLDDNSSPTT